MLNVVKTGIWVNKTGLQPASIPVEQILVFFQEFLKFIKKAADGCKEKALKLTASLWCHRACKNLWEQNKSNFACKWCQSGWCQIWLCNLVHKILNFEFDMQL